VFLSRDKTLWRKFRELVLALRLEKELGKKKILETYLNIAEWGPGIFGIGPAANYYFHKSPAELNAKEGAFLAMLLPSPIRYGQSFRKKQLTPFVVSSIRSILKKMVQAGFLTDEERVQVAAIPFGFEEMPAPILPEGSEPTEESTEDAASTDEGTADQAESSAPSQNVAPAPSTQDPTPPEQLFDEPNDSGT